MIHPVLRAEDPAVTAYVLGELTAVERAEVDAAASADPALRAALDEAAAAAGVLSAALKQELSSDAGPALDPARRAAILERAATGAPVLSLTSRLRRWGLFAATAAAVMIVGFVAFSGAQRTLKVSDISKVSPGDGPPGPAVGSDHMVIDDGDSVIGGLGQAEADRTNDVVRLTKESEAVTAGLEKARRDRDAAQHLPGGVPNLHVPLTTFLSGPTAPRPGDSRVAEVGSGGGAGGPATWQGQGRGSIRVNQRLFFGTPANPQGVPFGVHPEPASGGTSKDSGVVFTPPTRDLVPSGAVNDESNPLFGGESETPESYRAYVENAFRQPKGELALSTFSIDVDTASYANVRRMLGEGRLPPADAVRVEELLNYFPYAYAGPAGDEPFAVHLEVAGCPWSPTHRLVRVGIKGREVARKERPASNLVFLLDVSGSMDLPNKLPLVKASMRMLLDELNERDKVSIVTYAGQSGVALPPTSCEQKTTILAAIEKLAAGGSTNGASGIQLAYETAARGFIPNGVNRVILCTDGDWNVGITSHAELLKLITEKAKSRVFLTALGFGMDNLKDDTLELLADKGNGNYGYIDSTREAHKVLVEQAGGTLMTIAKDVKLQVEFNPATVAAYRLVGYDNRLLEAKDFNDDTKDAGEIGAGHTVTAFYELVPVGVELPAAAAPAPASVDPLRYQQPAVPAVPAPEIVTHLPPLPPPTPSPSPAPAPVVFSPVYASGAASPELLTVKLRWKAPEGDVSTKKEFPLTDGGASFDKASADFQFASAVAQFALLLKQSPYRQASNFDAVLEIAGASLGNDPGGWRAEFVDLVKKAKSLAPTK